MKRFTETQKWEDPWFRRLPVEMKLLWQWLCDRCDNACVIDPDLELASFQIGYQYPLDTLSKFDGRLVQINGGKWFIPKFIEFQYGTLSEECKAHRPIFTSLKKHQIKGYPYPMDTLQEKEKEKDKETDKETEKRAQEIHAFDSDNFREAWKRWQAHRSEKKHKLTPTCTLAQMKKCKALGEARSIAMINRSIEMGWLGLFEDPTLVTSRKSETSDQFSI